MATSAQDGSVRFSIPRHRSRQRAKELRAGIRYALQQGDRRMVVDCEAWDSLDLEMLSSLIQCVSVCREHGASLEFANMSDEVRKHVHDLQLQHRLGLTD
jgi:anti-anti-sigma regulatory factor